MIQVNEDLRKKYFHTAMNYMAVNYSKEFKKRISYYKIGRFNEEIGFVKVIIKNDEIYLQINFILNKIIHTGPFNKNKNFREISKINAYARYQRKVRT